MYVILPEFGVNPGVLVLRAFEAKEARQFSELRSLVQGPLRVLFEALAALRELLRL